MTEVGLHITSFLIFADFPLANLSGYRNEAPGRVSNGAFMLKRGLKRVAPTGEMKIV
jgi:hypothetical protein